MEYTELTDFSITDMLTSIGNPGDARSFSRVHVTQLIRGLGEELEIPPFNKSNSNKVNLLDLGGNNYSELGFLWEEVLERTCKEKLGVRTEEVELDGIVGSPDGFGVSPFGPCIEEYKCTWRSMKNPPHTEWRYMMQVKAYCKILGINQVLFRVLYINGDYKPPCPQDKAYLYVFDQEEVDQCWFQLTSWGIRAGLLPAATGD